MATKANITIDAGSDYSIAVNVTQANGATFIITGSTAACKVRKHFSSNTSYSLSAAVTDGTTGEITLSANAAYTATIPPGRYSYDVELYQGATTTRVLQGYVTVTPEMTY